MSTTLYGYDRTLQFENNGPIRIETAGSLPPISGRSELSRLPAATSSIRTTNQELNASSSSATGPGANIFKPTRT